MSNQQRDTTTPTSMADWPSYAYWCNGEARIKQFWYVSFCLMMSSVQDRLTGLSLQATNNLNWATTAFYYSSVHAGRLACFIACGDYPTGHAQLANLLTPTQARTEQQPARRFHFDWLGRFLRYVQANPCRHGGEPRPHPDRKCLCNSLRDLAPELLNDFERFAPLPAKFKNLRNDCNYEALLVAHEVNHQYVSKPFAHLVEAADGVSRIAVDFAVNAYRLNLENADCFEDGREKFIAAHTDYVLNRVQASLNVKFAHCEVARKELQRIANALQCDGESDSHNLEDFLDPIMFDEFGEKQGLMKRWSDDIKSLKGALSDSTVAPDP